MRLKRALNTISPLIFVIISLILGGLTYYIVLKSSYKWQDWAELKDRRVINFRVDSSFTEKERLEIENALRRWEKATEGDVILRYYIDNITILEPFRFKSDGIPTIYRGISRLSWKRHIIRFNLDIVDADTIGLSMTFSGDLFILKGGEDFEDLVAHEIGHVLINTPWHSENPDSVMYPTLHEKSRRYKILQEEVNLVKQNGAKQ